MAKLENLFTKGSEGDRDCAISTIESILDIIRNSTKVLIRNPNKRCLNDICHPNDAIYYTAKQIFIPEKIVEDRLQSDSYLPIEDLVEILSNTRYAHRRIIPKDFYIQIEVSTPMEVENVDCLIVNYPILRKISNDLIFGELN